MLIEHTCLSPTTLLLLLSFFFTIKSCIAAAFPQPSTYLSRYLCCQMNDAARLPSGHRQLQLFPGQLAICANYGPHRDACRRARCTYLHVCRAWLAGYCSSAAACSFKHSLVSDVANRRVLVSRLGASNVGDCDENMRREIKRSFAALCTVYIYKRGTCVKTAAKVTRNSVGVALLMLLLLAVAAVQLSASVSQPRAGKSVHSRELFVES